MLNIITSTDNGTSPSGKNFTITYYAVAGYTLSRIEVEGGDRIEWKCYGADDAPTITDLSDFMADVPEYGVNWSARGAHDTAGARAYAMQLATAADVADVFNRIVYAATK